MTPRSRLDPVLKLRRRAEDVRARALAAAVTERERATHRFDTLREATAASRDVLASAALRGVAGGHLLLAALLAEQSRQAAAAQAARVKAAESREGVARAAVVTAAQQRRAVERVMELRRAEILREQATREQKRLDDVATTRAARRRAPGGSR
jgi:flagellar export protein FliJ